MPDAAPAARRGSVRALVAVALTALVAYGADQGAKALVVAGLPVGESVPVIGDLLRFTHVTNSGAAFSLGSGFTWVLSLLAAVVVVAIIWFARRIRSLSWGVAFGLVLGGAVGNLTDRLVRPPGFGRGEVVDFLQLWGFPAIFNLADVAVCSGVAVFVVLTLRGIHLDGSRGDAAAPEEDRDIAVGSEAPIEDVSEHDPGGSRQR